MSISVYVCYVLALTAVTTSLYAALTEDDGKCLLTATIAIVSLSLIMLCIGATSAAALQIALAAGFLATAGFFAPSLGGRVKPARDLWLGALGAIVVALAFLGNAPRELPLVKQDVWSSIALALTSLPLLAALVALRLIFKEVRR